MMILSLVLFSIMCLPTVFVTGLITFDVIDSYVS